MRAEDRSTERGTVSWLVRRYVASRTDITAKAQEQYEWAIPHIENGLGAIPLATLDRDDVTRWIEVLAAGGRLSKRSVQICRTVLRAALSEAVEEGLIPQSPAARFGLPRTVAKPVKDKDAVAWTEQQVDRFLAATANHRWAIAFRLGVLYGLRRSEVLALRWDDLDTEKPSLRIDESLVATNEGAAWGNAKNERSRRTIPIDADTMRVFARRRADQVAERRWSHGHSMPANTHFVQPMEPEPAPGESVEGLLDGDDERPLVYVTFGTAFNTPELFRLVFDAVADLDVRVVATIGMNNEAADMAIPDNVRTVPFLSQGSSSIMPTWSSLMAATARSRERSNEDFPY